MSAVEASFGIFDANDTVLEERGIPGEVYGEHLQKCINNGLRGYQLKYALLFFIFPLDAEISLVQSFILCIYLHF